MLKRVLLVIPAIVLLATACTSGEDENDTPPVDTPEATATATEEAVAPENAGEEELALAGDSFDPLGLLSNSLLGMGPATAGASEGWTAGSGDADPALEAALLRAEDLPPGYASLGVMEFSLSPDDLLETPGAPQGPMEMASTMFFGGDMMSGDISAMVMSAAMVLPDDVMAEAMSGFEETALLDDEALAEFGQTEAIYGVHYEDLSVLDASGLGEYGVGVHMVMRYDTAMLAGMPEASPFADGMAMDVYMFMRGGKALMLGTIWPADQASPLDTRSLAQVMDAHAVEAF